MILVTTAGSRGRSCRLLANRSEPVRSSFVSQSRRRACVKELTLRKRSRVSDHRLRHAGRRAVILVASGPAQEMNVVRARCALRQPRCEDHGKASWIRDSRAGAVRPDRERADRVRLGYTRCANQAICRTSHARAASSQRTAPHATGDVVSATWMLGCRCVAAESRAHPPHISKTYWPTGRKSLR